ncbi:hypothetical protein EDD29_6420 [Actinocorallia herbida]|uniref:Uncharacterized protein n=1 Tax=Actinocorallia herbida TaxID=58109 RepID=A0A3N1D5B8_9ACTN|nr:hypothetical protein [Actinocorallia herbida]ROO88741.1 hypothetical protein EDD29_6420 [Actinocorallia herbida]
MKIPLDLNEAKFLVLGAPRERVDFETKMPVVKDGVQVMSVELALLDGAEWLPVRVSVAGDPGVVQGQIVKPVAPALNMTSRRGEVMTWWTCDGFEADGDAAAAPAPAPARGKAGGAQ